MKLKFDSKCKMENGRDFLQFFGERDASGVVEVTSNLTLLATENGEIRLLTAGVYHDRVIQQGGDWRLLGRHLELDKPY